MARRRSNLPNEYAPAATLRASLRRFSRATEEIVAAAGLTTARYELLLFVESAARAGEPATVTSLCDPLQTTQGSVTQLVAGAEREGLVMRTPSAVDGRVQHLALTPEGRRRLRRAFRRLGPERERLRAVLRET